MRSGATAVRAAAVAALGILAAPAAAGSLRLADAIGRARAANAELRAAAADLEAARGRLRQAGLVPANPVLGSELSRHRKPPPEGTGLDREISLGQEVEVGGQRGLRLSGARHDVARAEHVLADKQRTVDGEVQRAFAGVTAAERRRDLAAESAAVARRVVEATRRRARAGDVGELEVQLAQIEVTRAEQALAAAEVDRARAGARLATAIGAEPGEVVAVAEDEGSVEPPPSEEALVARALAARPDLAAAREERARLDAEADLTHRRGWLPNPTFEGFYRQEVGDERVVGGRVSVPLPVWNRQQGAEAELRAQALAAAAEAARLMREIPRQVHLAFVRRATAAAAWERYQREALPAAGTVRELLERAFGSGYLGLPEVLVQQDRLVQVRSAAIGAWLDLREAEADLIEAVGEGGE